jgi:hypothetical protein
MFVKARKMDVSEMVAFIVEQSEKEGHFTFFESRGRMWQMLKESDLSSLA